MVVSYVPDPDNYTIEKGVLLLKLKGETAFRDFGDCSDFKLNVESESQEHFSSRGGLKQKDADITTQQKATISFTLDELSPENAMFFSMSVDPTDVVQGAASVTDQAATAVHNQWLDLGKTKLSNVVVTGPVGTPVYVAGTDYEVDVEEGLLRVLSSGSIADSATLEVDFDHAAETRKRIDAATRSQIEGDLVFVGNPPKGRKVTIKGFVTVKPGGELALIGDEIVKMQFSGEFLKRAAYNGLYEWYDRGKV